MSYSIREAESRDLEPLQILIGDLAGHSISREDMTDRLQFIDRSEFDRLYVCESDGKILGLLGFRIRENLEERSRFGEISAIDVNQDQRQSGIGRFMMEYAEKLAKDLGCKGIWLVSGFAREEKAHKFYKRLGYRITGYRFIKLFK